jgi:Kef-type K+ transport system membrane component KefB
MQAIARDNLISRYFSAVAAGLPCLYLSYALMAVWIDPMSWDSGRWVPYGVGLLLMEFLILHSAGMTCGIMAEKKTRKEKYKILAGLFLIYCVMGLGFAAATDSPSLLGMLIAIMVGRFVTVINPEQVRGLQKRTAYGVMLYMACTTGTVFIAVPEMGITPEVLAEVYPSRGGGVWERYPQRPIVAGAVYFGVMGILELFVFSRSQHQRLPLNAHLRSPKANQ